MKVRSHKLHKVLYMFIIFVAAFSVTGNCQNPKSDSGWPLPIYEEGCKSLMNAMHKEWAKTDGALTIVFGKKLIWALLLNPNAFYEEFSSDTVNYKRFTKSMENTIFWNPNDTTIAHLERFKVVALERLIDQSYLIDSIHIDRHQELIERLRNVKVRFID